MPHVELSFVASAFVVGVLVLAAIVTAIFFYRRTLPPVPTGRRIFLTVLRATALSLLFILLFEPMLRLVVTSNEAPVLAVLIDNSKSMKIVDKAGARATMLTGILDQSPWQNLPNGGETQFYSFGSTTRQAGEVNKESLALDEDATDISAALRRLMLDKERQNIQAAVLLTDGSYNIGQNPVYETDQLGFPLFTVGIGDSTDQKDLLVSKIVTNDLVYNETEVPVDVTLRSSGFKNERVEVTLLEGARELKRASLVLAEGTRDYSVQFTYVPEGEGTKKLSVRVSSLPGELTTENNRRSFLAKVLKSKLKILIVAGAPSTDVSMTRQTLTEERNYAVRALTQRPPSGFYEGQLTSSVLDSADCVVLVGYPTSSTPDATVETLRAAFAQKLKPLLFISGKAIDQRKLAALASVLPFSASSDNPAEQLVFAEPASLHKNHPIVSFGTGGGTEVWKRLPPIFATQGSHRAKTEATVLAFSKINTVVTAEPLILVRHVTRQKSVAILGYGVWRWRLMAQGNPETEKFYATFLGNAIRWLTMSEDNRPVKVTPTKESFTQGEPVEFVGQVYDASANTVDNAQLRVIGQKDGKEFEAFLRPIGSGRYGGVMEGLQEGGYTFRALAQVDGQPLGEDKGRFSVGELNLEFQDTRMNAQLLRQLASRTGGEFLLPPGLTRINNLLASRQAFTSRAVQHVRELELWNWRYALAFVVLLFAVEWFLRKRSGML